MISEKEKLQEELKFLNESFESGVISKEEHGDAVTNINARLRELEVSVQEKSGLEEEKIEIKELKIEDVKKPTEEIKEESEAKEEEQKIQDTRKSEDSGTADLDIPASKSEDLEEPREDTISIDLSWIKKIFRGKPKEEEKPVEEDEKQKTLDEIKEEEPKEEVEQKTLDEIKPEGEEKVIEEKPVEKKEVHVEEPKEEVQVKEEREADKEEKPVEKKEEVKVEEKKVAEVEEKGEVEEKKSKEVEKVKAEEPEEEKPEEEPQVIIEEEKKKGNKLMYIAIIFIIAVGSGYFFFSGSDSGSPIEVPDESPTVLIACSSDDECYKEGSIGTCKNPGLEEAECEYIKDVEIKLTILNTNECFNCGTARVLSILNEFFPNLEIENIDFDTEEGKEIKAKYIINSLPAYIFDSNFEQAYNYDKFSTSFNVARESFVMKNTVGNANYYLDREEIPNKLDLIVKQNQTASLKAEENLQEFLEAFEVEFEKHDENDDIAKELGINTFPIFLVNNKVKFDGVQSANTIKENFCQMNNVSECSLELTKSLI